MSEHTWRTCQPILRRVGDVTISDEDRERYDAAAQRVWATLPPETRQAWHAVCCLLSGNHRTVQTVATVMEEIHRQVVRDALRHAQQHDAD